jgi:hypothetical protein
VFQSSTVKECLEAAKSYAHISSEVAELRAAGKPLGKRVGDRISAYERLRTRLILLDIEMSKLKSIAQAAKHDWVSKVQWENER